jgi:hypothetical protein
MRTGKSVKALEQAIEQEILAFWAWLGASEAPESWDAAADQLDQPNRADPLHVGRINRGARRPHHWK